MGLLDNLGSLSPEQSQSLLAAAAQMLQQSGPSLRPTSMGQILGGGYMTGSNAFNAATETKLNRQKEQAQLDILQQQAQQATRKNDLVNNFLAQTFGGGQGQPQQGSVQPQQNIQAPQQPMGSQPQQQGMLPQPSQGSPSPMQGNGSMFGGVPSSAIAADLAFNNGSKMSEMINDRSKQTDFAKQLMQAGIDPNSAIGRKLMQDQVAKMNYIAPLNTRPGSIIRDPNDPSKVLSFNPHIPDGGMPQFDANGNVTSISALPGAADIMQSSARAGAAGKASVEPIAGVDANGNPVFTNKLAAASGSGGGQLPRSGQPNLNNMSAQDRADLMQHARDQFSLQPGANPGSSVVRPAAPPGFAESQSVLATTGAKRYNDMLSLASDSPTRVNVYDNILNLSKEGVVSGPGEAWKNKVKGYAANTPLLSQVTGNWKNDVAGFQELNKFMYQNAQRNWQAAGGTGTDSQLEAFSKSNPNDSMFPQALQKMAEWGKAGELALQGKANAMQQWKDSQGGNVANQDQFERMWRNNFDPQLFQLKTMEPQQATDFINNLKNTNPNAYSNLMMKAKALKTIGGL